MTSTQLLDPVTLQLKKTFYFFSLFVGFGLIALSFFLKPESRPREAYGQIVGLQVDVADAKPADRPLADRPLGVTGSDTASSRALVREVSVRYHIEPVLAHSIVRQAAVSAARAGLPTTLVLAVIAQESSFRPGTIGSIDANDHGLMQVNVKYHGDKIRDHGGLSRLHEVSTNIALGTSILAEYVSQEGTFWGGLRRYNGLGKANRYPDEVLARKRDFDNSLRNIPV